MVLLVHKRDEEGLEQGCQALAMKIGKADLRNTQEIELIGLNG